MLTTRSTVKKLSNKEIEVENFSLDDKMYAKKIISKYNKVFPDDKKALDHILAFINSKNARKAQTTSNLQITDLVFNNSIKNCVRPKITY